MKPWKLREVSPAKSPETAQRAVRCEIRKVAGQRHRHSGQKLDRAVADEPRRCRLELTELFVRNPPPREHAAALESGPGGLAELEHTH